MNWSEAIKVQTTGDNRFSAHVDEHWRSLQGAHGGIVAALQLAAVEQVLADQGVDARTTLRSATFGYVRGNSIGDLEMEVEVIRRGRAMVTTQVHTTQKGKTTTLGRFHHSTPWEGTEFSDAPAMPPRPAETVRLQWGDEPAHLNSVETYLHPDTKIFGGADRAEWIAWSRPLHGGTFGSAWLTMFGDYFPPAVFTRVKDVVRAVTIEYSIQIHSAAGSWTLADDEYLASRFHAFHAHDGFAVEDGWIYLPDGALLATVRQTRLSG